MNTTATEAKMIKRMMSKGHTEDRAREIIAEGYAFSFDMMLKHLHYWGAITTAQADKWDTLARELNA